MKMPVPPSPVAGSFGWKLDRTCRADVVVSFGNRPRYWPEPHGGGEDPLEIVVRSFHQVGKDLFCELVVAMGIEPARHLDVDVEERRHPEHHDHRGQGGERLLGEVRPPLSPL